MQSDAAQAAAAAASARATAYGLLAEILLPPTDEVVERLSAGATADDLQACAGRLSADGVPALRDALQARRGRPHEALHREYVETFAPSVGHLFPPYATEYDDDKGFRKEQELADIAGYYKAFGVALADDFGERVDHFGTLADFLGFLSLKEAYAHLEHGPEEVELVRGAALRFARECVGPAVGTFAERLGAGGGADLYVAAAATLAALVHEELGEDGMPRRRVVVPPDPIQESARVLP